MHFAAVNNWSWGRGIFKNPPSPTYPNLANKVEKSEKNIRMLEMYPLFIHNLWINRIINVENSGIIWKMPPASKKIDE
ncbi:hypothetical protein CE91St62_02200 [Lachnospiraceae bacterium]|nr:hypothetical protein CE91St61_02220 [Lachnospiraceae bacterium]BDF36159.1 hypothetical protein CE91St62_02200 [Lachnospiraceae bacterium]